MPDSSAIVTQSPPPSLSHSENLGELATALAKAQGEIEGAKKDANNPFFRSKYADLASVWDACRAPLSKHGLSIVQFPTTEYIGAPESYAWTSKSGEEQHGIRIACVVSVVTRLLHSTGQWIEATMSAMLPTADPQAVGSACTYLRRYSLQSVVGVAPEDDDGNAASGRTANGSSVPATSSAAPAPKPSAGGDTISEPQQKRLFAIAKGKGWTDAQMHAAYGRFGITHTREIKRADYDDIVAFFEAGPVASGIDA
jgi:hypothetical protein